MTCSSRSIARHPPGLRGFVLLAGLVGLIGASSSPLRADAGAPPLPDFDNVSLAPGVSPAGGLTFEIGHFRLEFESGRAAKVIAAGRPVGLFIVGEGTFRYTCDDPMEEPLFRSNTKKATRFAAVSEPGRSLLRGPVESVLILGLGVDLPVLPAAGPAAAVGPTATAAPAFAAGPLSERFAEHARRFRPNRLPPASHGMSVQSLDAPSGAWARTEIAGGVHPLVHTFDSVLERVESLVAIRHPDTTDPAFKGSTEVIRLSRRPIGHDRREPAAPRFLLTAVDYTLVASAGRDMSLAVTEEVVPLAERTSVLVFRLDDRAVDASRAGGSVLRRLRVRSVRDGSGRTLAFHHENDELLVALAEPVAKGMIVRLRFEIEGDMLIRPVGDNYWQLGTTAWFPQAGLGGDYYTLHSVVKVPAPFVPFAPGTTVRRVQEGTLNVLESNIDLPVRFAVVLAGNYGFSEEAREGLTVRVASYGGRNEKAMKRLTELAFSIIRFYERFLGPFPGDEFNIIEINDWGFGQGPPGTMFITREAFDPFLGDPVRHVFSQGINERFAHEIAHQYWGGSVKWASEEETWLSESFAEYSAALFVRKAMGEAEYKALLSGWKSLAKDASPASTIPLAPGIEDGGDTPFGFRVYFGLLYCKGPWLLSRIHAEIGEERFLTFLKSYQKTFRGRSGTTRDVAGLLEAVSGQDYRPFLERNFWGTGLPD